MTEFIISLETAVPAQLNISETVNSICVITETHNSVSGNSGPVNSETALPTLAPTFEKDCFYFAPLGSTIANTKTDNIILENQKSCF